MTLLAVLVFFTACSLDGESAVYSHLQNQDPSSMHKTGDDFLPELPDEEDEEVPLAGHCDGEFTLQEQTYRDMELQAVTENDPARCLDLPNDPLVVGCPDQPLILYYSKTRCLEYFSE